MHIIIAQLWNELREDSFEHALRAPIEAFSCALVIDLVAWYGGVTLGSQCMKSGKLRKKRRLLLEHFWTPRYYSYNASSRPPLLVPLHLKLNDLRYKHWPGVIAIISVAHHYHNLCKKKFFEPQTLNPTPKSKTRTLFAIELTGSHSMNISEIKRVIYKPGMSQTWWEGM